MIREFLDIPSEYKLKHIEKKSLLFSFFILFSTYPYIFYRIVPLPPVFVLLILSCFYIVYYKHMIVRYKSFFKKDLLIVAGIQLLGTYLCMLVNFDFGYCKQIIYIVWIIVFFKILMLITIKKFLFYYGRILFFVGLLGVISTILSIVFGVKPLFEYTNMDGRPGWFVYFTFTNVRVYDIIRYSGIFDEAGAFANWVMYYLIINKIYIKDLKIEKPLIFVTLFTFSFGFYLQLIFYFLFFYLLESRVKTKFLFLMILPLFIFLFIKLVPEDSPIYSLTIGRLGFGSDLNIFEENNRTELSQIAKGIYLANPFFGIGITDFSAGVYAADNPYETLAKDGIIGTLFIYSPLIWILFKTHFNRTLFFSTIIIMIGYLHRPFHNNLQHFLMIYIYFCCCYEFYNNIKREKTSNCLLNKK